MCVCVHLLGGCPALHDIWVFLHQGVTLELAQAADVAIQGFQQVLLSPLHLYTTSDFGSSIRKCVFLTGIPLKTLYIHGHAASCAGDA